MKSSIWVVMVKEIRDAVRDRRALRLAFLPPVYMVVFFALGIGFSIHFHNNEDLDIELPVSGMDRAPALMSWLTEKQIRLRDVEGDVYGQVESGELDYVLMVPERDTAAPAPYNVWLVYNASQQSVHRDLGEVRHLVQLYSRIEGSIQVLARGLSPQLVNPVVLREANVASEQQMGGLVLSGVPLLLLMCAMMGSMGFAADMTAGERERRSLESLLINPVDSLSLMAGKWLAALILTLAVVLLCLGLLAVALYFLPFNQIGLRVSVNAMALGSIFGALVPVAALAAALQLLLGILSRSFKDAQTFMSILVLLPMVPFFIVLTNPGFYQDWHLWVPLLGHQTVLKNLLLAEPVPALAFAAFWLSAVPLTLLALWLAARQLRRAKVIYG